MGIKARFTQADVDKMLREKAERIERAILSRLQYIGEKFVNNARKNHTYLDQTGNLTSSIAYIVLKDGTRKKDNYKKSEKGSGGEEGLTKARAFIEELKVEFPKGYVLICVAGMNYAASVESKGKDVITASSITAKKDLEDAVAKFKNTLK